ncbi:MAG: nucleoside-diphosphate kinase [Nanoarchaeota archaeon]|nr:nucleoside-diphosphate kinase [Nanoarchaeota archaeon]MBU1005149.1 nucleoside-diphosphate kinase [Nanoarchaeota archaeon]MBU1946386.1 nucleoside-diphosphate kinase [Nanoarchaeota archaeon]
MAVEQSLMLIKPDGLVKSLTGDIISKMSETELKIVGAKVVQVTRELAEEHYQHLREAKFFDELIKYIMGEYHTKRVLALVYHGEDAIKSIRKIVGSTNPEKAEPTSIRGKYGRITSAGVFENVVHASENPKEAEREIKLWFRPDELVYTLYPTKIEKVTIDKVFWK